MMFHKLSLWTESKVFFKVHIVRVQTRTPVVYLLWDVTFLIIRICSVVLSFGLRPACSFWSVLSTPLLIRPSASSGIFFWWWVAKSLFSSCCNHENHLPSFPSISSIYSSSPVSSFSPTGFVGSCLFKISLKCSTISAIFLLILS